jgi:hypothetical protein
MAGVRNARRGLLPWDEARSDGRGVAARNRPTSWRIRRRPVAGDVAVEDTLLHVLPRSRGAIGPGTGRCPGQTVGRARGLSGSHGLWPAADLRVPVYQSRRYFHHSGCRISGISDCWRIPSGGRPAGIWASWSTRGRRIRGARCAGPNSPTVSEATHVPKVSLGPRPDRSITGPTGCGNRRRPR